MWQFIQIIHKWGSPKYFYQFSGRLTPALAIITVALFCYGLIGALYLAPADFQQGDGFRIIYVHVPTAFTSIAIYTFMTIAAVIAFIWKMKLADAMIKISAPLGAWFTFLALITGSIWGKPMWGTWWVWDARLTSELILLFIYLGIIALQSTIPDRNAAARAVRIFVIVGFINIPIIHFSVNWWNTLHQGSTIRFLGRSLMAPSMLHPLIAMIFAFLLFFGFTLLKRTRCELLEREKKTKWVIETLNYERVSCDDK